ncbi:putative cation transporter [Nocardioides phosphati]|uniref:Cation transporter n=1 Tax=Nocardioides phosphati TaxID=1867775 RepID=A0ABQ2N6V9_9ACTN|nr:cation diffusion facilitator family transporter [Nocardioides phosphati]GGO85003.1 putative cation transporter [Nocardioides phosphati]
MSDHSHVDSKGAATAHAGHAHGVSADADKRWLVIALALICAYMTGEVIVGVISGSLALLSDAAHMLTDAGAIALALFAMRLAARPPRGGYTYGLKRAEILSAQANGVTLLVLAGWLAYEGVRRLIFPPNVEANLVLITALVGIVVNLVAAWSLAKANRASLNVEGAFQHILTDLFAFIATAIAAIVMLVSGYQRADAIASLVVVALMLKSGVELVRAATKVLMEAAPAGTDPDAIGRQLAGLDEVAEVHDLHVWQITSGQTALSAHVLVAPGGDCHAVQRRMQALLGSEHDITHTTLQVDHATAHTSLAIDASLPAEQHCENAHGPTHRA